MSVIAFINCYSTVFSERIHMIKLVSLVYIYKQLLNEWEQYNKQSRQNNWIG